MRGRGGRRGKTRGGSRVGAVIGSIGNTTNRANAATATAWKEVPFPDQMPIHYDIVNSHMGYAATRENHASLERCMQRLYPNWKHGINKPVRCIYDGSRKCRSPNDLGVKQSLQLLLRWDDFGRHIWDQVRPVATTFGLEIEDVVRFMKTFCLILCYGVSIDRYYKNRRKVRTQLIYTFVLIFSSCAILRIFMFA